MYSKRQIGAISGLRGLDAYLLAGMAGKVVYDGTVGAAVAVALADELFECAADGFEFIYAAFDFSYLLHGEGFDVGAGAVFVGPEF